MTNLLLKVEGILPITIYSSVKKYLLIVVHIF
jgi:hypothetical protein